MADQRFLYTEEVVGANHGTKADTINRLALVDHNNDGTHKAYIVRAKMTGAQSIDHNLSTYINWNAEDEDVVGAHDTVTNNSRITVPTGFTRVDLEFYGIWVSNTTGFRSLKIVKNGTTDIDPQELTMPNTFGNGANRSGILGTPCVAGDFYQAAVYQTSGAALYFDVQSYFFARFYKG